MGLLIGGHTPTNDKRGLEEWEWEAITEILSCFDFEKVHKTMELLEWKWYSIEGIPDQIEIRNKAKQLLVECCKRDYSFTGFGGLFVESDKENKYLKLSFQVEHWEYPYE